MRASWYSRKKYLKPESGPTKGAAPMGSAGCGTKWWDPCLCTQGEQCRPWSPASDGRGVRPPLVVDLKMLGVELGELEVVEGTMDNGRDTDADLDERNDP